MGQERDAGHTSVAIKRAKSVLPEINLLSAMSKWVESGVVMSVSLPAADNLVVSPSAISS